MLLGGRMNSKKFALLSAFVLSAIILTTGCAYNALQLTTSSTQNGIQLNWSEAADSAGYNIYRGTSETKLERLNAQPIQQISYLDKNTIPNLVYYYKIIAVDNYGKETASSNAATAIRTEQEILNSFFSINDGAEYTTRLEVELKIAGIGVQKCRFRNEENVWTMYEGYAPEKIWTLSQGDGQKTVSVQCKDSSGNEAQAMQNKITLMANKPTITLYEPDPSAVYFGAFNLTFLLSSSFNAVCSYNLDGSTTNLETINPGQLNTYFVGAEQGDHSVSVKCIQGPYAVETSKATAQVVTDEKIVRITINQGADYTNTRQVTLNLFAPKAQFCRYGNDEKNNYASWEPYYTMRYWRLTSEEGLKTVFYQCKDKDSMLIGTASDAIKLKYE